MNCLFSIWHNVTEMQITKQLFYCLSMFKNIFLIASQHTRCQRSDYTEQVNAKPRIY